MTETKTWEFNPKKGQARKWVSLYIGDRVMDVYSDEGAFIVEEINEHGWVWGSGMKHPYCSNGEKNFGDNHIMWKINESE
jgi:hypothetical protein